MDAAGAPPRPAEPARAPRVAVIGIGNVLAGDDAAGPTALATFDAWWKVPAGVEVMDAGTPGLDLTASLAALDGAVIVDAIRAAGPPGEIRVLTGAALRSAPVLPALGPHDPGVRAAVLHAELARGAALDVRLVGVVAGVLETGIGLSAPVRAAVPDLVLGMVQALRALGVAAVKRDPPGVPALWWERGGAPELPSGVTR